MRRTCLAIGLGAALTLHAGAALAQTGRHTFLPPLWLEQLRASLEHLDGNRVAMPDPARWPLAPMPEDETPRMILFSGMKPGYLADHAEQAASWGFRGYLFGVGNWNADVWAVDGDAETRGADDAFFREVRECNRKCAEVGIDSNCLKISFGSHLPDWFDDAEWADLTERWRQLAICARDTGCAGVAQDWEYIGDQYHLDFEGYDYTKYNEDELRRKVTQRMRDAMGAMLDEFPEMVFFTLPENVLIFPASLCDDMYQGVLEAMAQRKAPGGTHLMIEFTYLARDPVWLIAYAARIRQLMDRALRGTAQEYWRSHCTIAEAGWPLGTWVPKGQLRALGPGLKSGNYSAAQFRTQVAAMRMACPRYTWVYGPRSAWWQMPAADVERYGASAADAEPAVPDLDAYRAAIAQPRAVANPALQRLAECVRTQPLCDMREMLALVDDWWIIGPFANPDRKALELAYPPESDRALGHPQPGLSGPVRWTRHHTTDPLGVVDLGALYGETQAVAFALCYVHADRETQVQVRLASNDESAVWLGRDQVWVRREASRVRCVDADIAPVTIPKGTTPLLVKACNRGRAWEFCLRLTDAWGLPLQGVRCTADPNG